MRRLRLYDLRVSGDLDQTGLCASDINRVGKSATKAQQRLIMCKETGDEGWWGTYAEMAFTVSRTQPYLTTPRSVARIEAANVCDRPVLMFNQFYEYLQFGNGRMPKLRPFCDWPLHAVYSRNNVPVQTDPTIAPFYITIFAQDPVDVQAAKRVLIQGTDQNGMTVYSQDGASQVTGKYIPLDDPFASSSPLLFNTITGIQKDVTQGGVQIFQVDPNTGAQTLLAMMEPTEQTTSYRRYFFNRLPWDCCASAVTPGPVNVTAIVKLDPLPLIVDTDYFTLQGDAAIEAVLEEMQSMRYDAVDETAAKSMADKHHKNAVNYLNGILAHYLGKNDPAVIFKPFGSATLRRRHVGMI